MTVTVSEVITRRVLALAWLSLGWMTVEGVLGLVAGLAAGSIALTGWALGSVIEGAASVIVIWRFTGTRRFSEEAERRAGRAVAISFFVLAPYIAAEAIRDLVVGHDSGSSVVGIVVTAVSLVGMPVLGVAKRRYGRQLGSEATAGEGTQNLICATQAGAVLLSLAVNAAVQVSWLDPVVALLLAGWAVREGVSAWNGDDDCC
ncbi:MAG TPA: cation transporter [Mycobacteriales bacterium]|nr:cation transporter [Mycobacteriales bacterium]